MRGSISDGAKPARICRAARAWIVTEAVSGSSPVARRPPASGAEAPMNTTAPFRFGAPPGCKRRRRGNGFDAFSAPARAGASHRAAERRQILPVVARGGDASSTIGRGARAPAAASPARDPASARRRSPRTKARGGRPRRRRRATTESPSAATFASEAADKRRRRRSTRRRGRSAPRASIGVVGASPPPSGSSAKPNATPPGVSASASRASSSASSSPSARARGSPVASASFARQRRRRLRIGRREQDIDADRRRARRARGFDQPRDAFAPPGPRAFARQRGRVDVEDHDARLRRVRRRGDGEQPVIDAGPATVRRSRSDRGRGTRRPRRCHGAAERGVAPRSGAHARLRRTAPAGRGRRTGDRWCGAKRPPARACRARH